MKIIESNSGWKFEDLLEKHAKRMVDLYDEEHYINPKETIKDRLMDFLKELPNGDYDRIIKEYWK